VDGFSGALDLTETTSSVDSNGRRLHFGRGMTGVIVCRTANGVFDQVVFNTLSDETADFCSSVIVPNSTVVQSTSVCSVSSVALHSFGVPWVPYAALGVTAADVGPGAIGMHPFTPNIVESFPDFSLGMLYGDFTAIEAKQFDRRVGVPTSEYKDVVLTLNGLVYALGTDDTSPPLKLELIRRLDGMTLYDLIEPDKYRVEVVGTPNAPNRQVKIHGVPTYKVSGGAYRVSLRPEGEYPLFCAGSTNSNDPAVGPFQFWFYLGNSPDVVPTGGECECNCWSADFNLDGGVTGDDIGAFFEAWTAGDATADVNGCDFVGDGGIDGADVERFITCWEAGSPC